MSLTAASFAEFTSVVISLPAPSSLKTAYPVIGQPPSSSGSSQAIVIELEVEVFFQGA